jgi:hypothetical protein
MEADQCKRLVRQRAVAKSQLTRLPKFVESDEQKVNDLQVRYEELPNIFCKFDAAQSELELSEDDVDHFDGREAFENQYYQVKARFIELLRPADLQAQSDSSSEHGGNRSIESTRVTKSHVKLPSIELPSYDGNVSK